MLDKVAEIETHLAEQVAFANQLRATAAALADRPLDGPCDDSCGCTNTASSPEQVSPSCDPGGGCSSGGDIAAVALGRRGDRDDSDLPVACSLTGTDMAGRIKEWKRVLDGVTTRRDLPGGVRLELDDHTGIGIGDLAALIDAEQTCCPFSSFAITLDHRGLALEVTAPPDGQDLLTNVFGDHH